MCASLIYSASSLLSLPECRFHEEAEVSRALHHPEECLIHMSAQCIFVPQEISVGLAILSTVSWVGHRNSRDSRVLSTRGSQRGVKVGLLIQWGFRVPMCLRLSSRALPSVGGGEILRNSHKIGGANN